MFLHFIKQNYISKTLLPRTKQIHILKTNLQDAKHFHKHNIFTSGETLTSPKTNSQMTESHQRGNVPNTDLEVIELAVK